MKPTSCKRVSNRAVSSIQNGSGVRETVVVLLVFPLLFSPFHAARSAGDLSDAPLTVITRAWQDSAASWADLGDAERRARGQRFYERFEPEDIFRLCRETARDESAPASHMTGFMRAKLLLDPVSIETMSALIADPTVGVPCLKGVILHLATVRDTLSTRSKETLATAMLELADQQKHPTPYREQLEGAAASLSARDELLERMRDYAWGPTGEIQYHGLNMMAQSIDPRARDLMEERLQDMQAQGQVPSGELMILFGRTLEQRAYDELHDYFVNVESDAEWRRNALQALSYTHDPRVMEILLSEYGGIDSEIRDRTFELADREERSRYWWLWHMTRVMEPALIEALAGDDPARRRQALELLDRASRFGVPEDLEGVLEALARLEQRGDVGEELAVRALRIISRFEQREVERANRKVRNPFRGDRGETR
ncbi:MAG: hypothetical protein GF355_15070 [Candidatus Eisenbacteria bacterium]|nr:hypothetical protein [Candidatus Eisenbacteria bacterium]